MMHHYFVEMLEEDKYSDAKLDAFCEILAKSEMPVIGKFEESFEGKNMMSCEFQMTESYFKIAEHLYEIVSVYIKFEFAQL